MQKIKCDNRGISLVEIIVSIAILAIIVLPFLNAFVVSARTNAKAKNEMNANKLATNIMEGIEKSSMNALAYQMNYPNEGFTLADGFESTSGACELLLNGSTYNAANRLEDVAAGSAVTSSIRKTDAKATINDTSLWEFVEKDSHKYYFFLTDVKSGNKKYNALVTLDARSDSRENTGKSDDGKKTKYNETSLAQITSVDGRYDAIDTDENSFELIRSEANRLGLVENDLSQSDVKRTITVDIEKNDGVTTVYVTYRYSLKDKTGKDVTFPVAGSAREKDFTHIIYDNSTDKVNNSLRNVYIYYDPWYSNGSITTAKNCIDTFVINNDDKIKCTVNIVKQNTGETNLAAKELNYKACVKVNESGNSDVSNVSIASNFDTNISSEASTKTVDQAIYEYNGSALAKDKISVKTGITQNTTEDRIYDVVVDVYDDEVTADNINKESPIVSITGSMVD